MSTEPTQQLVASPPTGDVPDDADDLIEVDARCRCGRNLCGLPADGACPACGADVAIALGDLEQASLDGRAARRLGASLLIANHVVWLCMMAAWAVGISESLRILLALLAAAGPRAVTSIDVLKQGTVREFATSTSLLTVLNLAGVWMLTTVRPREPGLDRLRKVGGFLRAMLVIAIAAGVCAFVAIDERDYRLLVIVNLLELPVGVFLGLYVAQLGAAHRSRLIERSGRAVATLLGFSSALLATAVLLWWWPDTSPRPWLYVSLSASAAGGLLLLGAVVCIRALLGEPAPESD